MVSTSLISKPVDCFVFVASPLGKHPLLQCQKLYYYLSSDWLKGNGPALRIRTVLSVPNYLDDPECQKEVNLPCPTPIHN
jgi:hypothetical protein